jgi:hypothetical protein
MTYLKYQFFRPDFAVLKNLGLASMSAKESATLGTVSNRFPIMMGFAGSAGLAGKIRDENGGNCLSFVLNCWTIFKCLNLDEKKETEIYF